MKDLVVDSRAREAAPTRGEVRAFLPTRTRVVLGLAGGSLAAVGLLGMGIGIGGLAAGALVGAWNALTGLVFASLGIHTLVMGVRGVRSLDRALRREAWFHGGSFLGVALIAAFHGNGLLAVVAVLVAVLGVAELLRQVRDQETPEPGAEPAGLLGEG